MRGNQSISSSRSSRVRRSQCDQSRQTALHDGDPSRLQPGACHAGVHLGADPHRSRRPPDFSRAGAEAYTAVDLGTLGGANSIAYAINPAGEIVGESGTSANQTHAFRWANGVMTDLGTLGGIFSRAFDITPAGQIVGGAALPNGFTHAFLWSSGVMTDLGTVGGVFSEAQAINPAGQVVGQSSTASGARHAFLWTKGVMTDLGTLGGLESQAWGIDPAGQVVGQSQTAAGRTHAFLWADGVMTDLGTLGRNFSQAYDINSAGRIVGASSTASGTIDAFIWKAGVMTDLGTLGGTTAAFGINPAGQVVGVSQAQGANHAILWQMGVLGVLQTSPESRSTVRLSTSVPPARSWRRAPLWQAGTTPHSGHAGRHLERRIYDMGARVGSFSDTEPDTDPGQAQSVAEVKGLVQQMQVVATAQRTGLIDRRAGATEKKSLRREILAGPVTHLARSAGAPHATSTSWDRSSGASRRRRGTSISSPPRGPCRRRRSSTRRPCSSTGCRRRC